MALGYTAKHLLLQNLPLRESQVGLQTLYNLSRWKKPKAILVGGGAVLTSETIRMISDHVSNDPRKVAFVGVDLLERDIDASALDFLGRASSLLMRSSEEALHLRSLGLTNAGSMPDLVFGGHAFLASRGVIRRRSHVLGVNVVPQAIDEAGGAYAKHYSAFLRAVVRRHLCDGWSVIHVPFTPQDHHAAKVVFAGLPVTLQRYVDSPSVVFRQTSSVERFVPSRYHSLVFAMLSSTPVIPFLYASKCYRLLADYFPGTAAFGVGSIAEALECAKAASELEPLSFNRERVERMTAAVQTKVQSAVRSLAQEVRLG
ncbi:polysaccharide pyruvyl transferase family protein [Cereibacter sphaeroides]|uniref:polysaccharide pyruvyl transferase family protein n=1 Tax=Cereibacter sphaeroides TaxID=1063 RepID=UPI00142D44D7|nr:polysaccharide pyruvyl transferase family protein [Cereibacter sphaeroides]